MWAACAGVFFFSMAQILSIPAITVPIGQVTGVANVTNLLFQISILAWWVRIARASRNHPPLHRL